MKRWGPILLLTLLLALLAGVLSPCGRRCVEAGGLLVDVWSVGNAGWAPPTATVTYAGPDGESRRADVYCDPSAPPGARLLLAHGLVDAGKDDARLNALGRAFARHRFLVVIPDFPGMRSLRVERSDIDEIDTALRAARLVHECGAADGLPVGAVGFSYSSGPVLLALDRPGVARPADFAVLFGGYSDLLDVVRFLTTGRHRDLGVDYGGETLPAGRWIVLQANAATVADPGDRAVLESIGRLKRATPEADVTALAAGLGPSGRALLDVFANTDSERFDALVGRIDPEVRATLDALSPSRSLERPLSIDLYLLHGRSDAVVPWSETLKLSRTVRTTGRLRVALLGGFRHARPQDDGGEPGWVEAMRYPADSARILGILMEILGRRRGTRPTAAAAARPGDSACSGPPPSAKIAASTPRGDPTDDR